MKLKKTVTAIYFVPELDGKGEPIVRRPEDGEFALLGNGHIFHDKSTNEYPIYRRLEVPVEVEYEAEPPVFEGYEFVGWSDHSSVKDATHVEIGGGLQSMNGIDTKWEKVRAHYRPVPKPFKVGDWVVCDKDQADLARFITIGKAYRINNIVSDVLSKEENLLCWIDDRGNNNGFYAYRFRHATPAEIAEATKPKRDWVKIFEDAADYFWNKANSNDCLCTYLFHGSPYKWKFQDAFFNFAQNKNIQQLSGIEDKACAWWSRDTYGNSQRALFCRQIAALGNAEIERRMNGGKDA